MMPHDPRENGFALEIHASAAADVYLCCPRLDAAAWSLVKALDQDSIAVVGDFTDADFDADRLRRIVRGCAGAIVIVPDSGEHMRGRLEDELRIVADAGLPLAIVHHGNVDLFRHMPSLLQGPFVYEPRPSSSRAWPSLLEPFIGAVVREAVAVRPYAFLIGRLERDFTHARDAIRAAVESEAGITCLWADDGRHQTNVDSIRENTRLLIKHANFVIADLTLGVESPERENPSRAHEIGMSIGYERKLMLSSQEPRRDPYFSIGDMQMVFWTHEGDLYATVKSWIRPRRHAIGRCVLNHQLPDVLPDYEARLGRPTFVYDPGQRYIGPKTDLSRG
jgi:hypothetical protein